jgi:hypothetical protein
MINCKKLSGLFLLVATLANAENGEYDVKTTVCTPTNQSQSGAAQHCSDGNFDLDKAWTEIDLGGGRTGPTCMPAYCNVLDPNSIHDPYIATNTYEIALDQVEPDLCCDHLEKIDIIVNTRTPKDPITGDEYRTLYSEGTIYLPPKNKVTNMIENVSPHKEWETILHEYGHHYMAKTNPRFQDDKDYVAVALNESFSDSALFAGEFHKIHRSVSADWKILERSYDENQPFSPVRDLTIPRSFDDFIYSGNRQHKNSMIFSNYFFRLSQQFDMSLQDVLRMLIRLPSAFPNDTLDNITIEEFKEKMEKIAKDIKLDPIINAVETINNQMEHPDGHAPGIPKTPSFIVGNFVVCDNYMTTDLISYEIIDNATYYELWGSPEERNTFTKEITTATTHGFGKIWGFDYGYWKVKACNSDGCSPLSTATYKQIKNITCE